MLTCASTILDNSARKENSNRSLTINKHSSTLQGEERQLNIALAFLIGLVCSFQTMPVFASETDASDVSNSNILSIECRNLAGDPFDPDRPPDRVMPRYLQIDPALAVEPCRKAYRADRTSLQTKYHLARALSRDHDTKEEAWKILNELIEDEHSASMVFVSQYFDTIFNKSLSPDRYNQILQRSSDLGNPTAFRIILYSSENIVEKLKSKDQRLLLDLKKIADSGDESAQLQFFLSNRYDYQKYLTYLELSARNGNPVATTMWMREIELTHNIEDMIEIFMNLISMGNGFVARDLAINFSIGAGKYRKSEEIAEYFRSEYKNMLGESWSNWADEQNPIWND